MRRGSNRIKRSLVSFVVSVTLIFMAIVPTGNVRAFGAEEIPELEEISDNSETNNVNNVSIKSVEENIKETEEITGEEVVLKTEESVKTEEESEEEKSEYPELSRNTVSENAVDDIQANKKSNEKENAQGIRYISEFAKLSSEEKELTFDIYEKPSMDELKSMMPDKLKVHFEDSDGEDLIDVDWNCNADYDDGYYFDFNPDWDETKYVLSDDISNEQIPVINVTIIPESTKDIEAMKANNDEDALIDETNSSWRSPNPVPGLTGNKRNDAIAYAKSQIGYREQSPNYNAYAYEIGAGYGTDNDAWCAYFVRWIQEKIGNGSNYITLREYAGKTTYTSVWFNNRSRYHSRTKWSYYDRSINSTDLSYRGKPGDFIAIDNNGSLEDGPEHTAFLVDRDDNYYYTVEGNLGDRVKALKYRISDGVCVTSGYTKHRISGFGEIEYGDNYQPANKLPIGAFDLAESSNGNLRVRGWAFDPDSPSDSIEIHVYVGGPAGSDAWRIGIMTGSAERPDVQNYYPSAGRKCGFDSTFPTTVRGDDIYVYVYAIDKQDRSAHTDLLCGSRKYISVNISEPMGITTNPSSLTLNYGESGTVYFNWQGTGFKYVHATWDKEKGVIGSGDWSKNDLDLDRRTGKIKIFAGSKIGTTDLNMLLLDSDENVVYKKVVPVTVKADNYVTFPSAINYVREGEIVNIPFNINGTGASKVEAYIEDTSIARNAGFENTSKLYGKNSTSIAVKGVKWGPTLLNIKIYDANNKVVVHESCAISVREKANISFENTTQKVGRNSIKTCDFTCSGYGAKNVVVTSSNTDIVEASLTEIDLKRGEGSLDLKGKKVGSTTVKVKLVDYNGNSLYEKTLNVSVQESFDVSLIGETNYVFEGSTADLKMNVAYDYEHTWDATHNIENPSIATCESYVDKSFQHKTSPYEKTVKITGVKAGKTSLKLTHQGYENGSGSNVVTLYEKTIPVIVTKFQISPKNVSGKVGESYTLTSSFSHGKPSDITVAYSSSNTSVAKVNSSGIVTFLKQGTAMITATTSDGKSSDTCTVNVVASTVAPTGISIYPKSAEIKVGETIQISPTVTPSNATDKSVVYSSSNTNIATVDADGKVTAVSTGTAEINVKTANGKYQKSCSVSVYLDGGTSGDLTWKITGTGGNYLLTITGNGKMTDFDSTYDDCWRKYADKVKKLNLGNGITYIGECSFYGFNNLEGKLIIPESVTEIGRGAFYECDSLTGELILPKNLKIIRELAFSNCTGLSGNLHIPENVERIEAGAFENCSGINGELILSEKITDIKIGAFQNTGFTEKIVIPLSVSAVSSKAFRGVPNKVFEFDGNAPEHISTKAFDSDVILYYHAGTSGWTTPTWNGYNTVEISAQSDEVKVTGISVSKTDLYMKVGDRRRLTYKITPDNASDKTATWSSLNENVVKVDEYGYLTAVGAGVTTISVTSTDGNIKAECEVYVANEVEADITLSESEPWVWVNDTKEIGFVAEGRGYDGVSFQVYNSSVAESGKLDKTTTYEGSGVTLSQKDQVMQEVTGRRAGTSTASIRLTRSGDTYTETVKQEFFVIKVAELRLFEYFKYLKPGETFVLTHSVYPEISTPVSVRYESDDTSVARVNSSGRVTAVSEGIANITVISADGKVRKTCEVEVVKDSDDYDKRVNIASDSITMKLSEKEFTYTGSSIEPEVTVEDKAIGKLVKDVDYKVSYENNVEVGTAYAIVTGIGDYYGKKEVSFVIVDSDKDENQQEDSEESRIPDNSEESNNPNESNNSDESSNPNESSNPDESREPDESSNPDESKEPDEAKEPNDSEESKLDEFDTTFASPNDTGKIIGSGKSYSIKVVSGNEAKITIAKGNKLNIENGKDFWSLNSQNITVSKKGIVKAKKSSTGNLIGYTRDDGKMVYITVDIVDPNVVGGSKLTATVEKGMEFDIPLNVPLNAEFEAINGKSVIGDVTKGIEKDYLYHIKGEALKKGSVTVKFTVNGKKFRLKIKVK